MGLTTAALVTMAVGTAAAAGAGTYSAIDANKAAKAGEKAASNATLASAAAQGRAEAKENALLDASKGARAAEAKNLSLEDAAAKAKRKRGVAGSYTAAGSGSGMMKGTSLTPIGGGDTGAVGAV